MSTSVPGQWLEEQRRLGNELCVTLDSQSALPALQRLLKGRAHDRYSNVYAQTVVAELAAASPFLILLDPADTESVRALCSAPQRDWGWLASLPPGALPAWTAHWRERCVSGTRPHLALYRFHDNRVLTRALAWLPEDTHPAYLGPAISVCYWAGDTWATPHNPAPGTYPSRKTPRGCTRPCSRHRLQPSGKPTPADTCWITTCPRTSAWQRNNALRHGPMNAGYRPTNGGGAAPNNSKPCWP